MRPAGSAERRALQLSAILKSDLRSAQVDGETTDLFF